MKLERIALLLSPRASSVDMWRDILEMFPDIYVLEYPSSDYDAILTSALRCERYGCRSGSTDDTLGRMEVFDAWLFEEPHSTVFPRFNISNAVWRKDPPLLDAVQFRLLELYRCLNVFNKGINTPIRSLIIDTATLGVWSKATTSEQRQAVHLACRSITEWFHSEHQDVSFSSLTVLEESGLAGKESTHTGLVSWILGEYSPLPLENRLKVLEHLLIHEACKLDGYHINSETELHRIDVLLRVLQANKTHVIAIENKLGSQERLGQLDRYAKYLKRFPSHSKIYLSLLGEEPRQGTGWHSLSYTDLLQALRKNSSGSESMYLEDYITSLHRLQAAKRNVVTDPNTFAGNGTAFSTLTPYQAPEGFVAYVSKLRLRTLLQKAWLQHLCLKVRALVFPLPIAKWEVSETNGEGLLDMVVKILSLEGQEYAVGIQLQNLKFKLFCHPLPYGKEVTLERHDYVRSVLEDLRESLNLDARLTTSRQLGFRSLIPLTGIANTLEFEPWANQFALYVRQMNEALETVSGT